MKNVLWSNNPNELENLDSGYREYYELEDDVEIDYESLLIYLSNKLDDDLEWLRDEFRAVELPGRVIVIADLGLWTGRQQAYKILSDDLTDVLYSDCDYFTIGYDSYDLVGKGSHHDGTNFYTYRVLKDDLSEQQIKNFTHLLYNGLANRRHITYYTKSIIPFIERWV